MINMASNVRRHITAAEPSRIFTTREMQYCGSRGAVDQELSRLVKVGVLIRLANGVFVRHDHPSPFLPPDEIVQAKAAAFGKRIARDGTETLAQLNVTDTPRDKLFYSSSGCTTEFNLTLHGMRVQLKGVSERKMQLGDSAPGTLLRALWQLGDKKCSSSLIHNAMQLLNRPEKESIWEVIFLMPAWLKHEIMPLLPKVPFEQKQGMKFVKAKQWSKTTNMAASFSVAPPATESIERTYKEGSEIAQRDKNASEKSSSINGINTPSENANSKADTAKLSYQTAGSIPKIRSFAELLYHLRSHFGFTPFGFNSNTVSEAPVRYKSDYTLLGAQRLCDKTSA